MPSSRIAWQWLPVSLFGIVVLFRDLPLRRLETSLWADDFDSKFIRWTVEWGFHALFQTAAPLEVWNSNAYYPAPLTLAYSDSMLSAQIFYAPLRLLGVLPGAALYLTLAAFCVLGCLLSNIALNRLKCFTAVEICLLLFGAHFSLPMTGFLYHYQLFGFQLAPPLLLFLLLYAMRWQVADLMGALLAFSLGVMFSIYSGPMLVTLGLVVITVRAIVLVRAGGAARAAQQVIAGFGPAAMFASIFVAALLYVVQLRPYFQVADGFPEQPYSETVVYSASPSSIVSERSAYSLAYKPAAQQYGDWERAYFPGIVLLGATAAFGVLWLAGAHRRVPPHPATGLAPYFIWLFVAAWVLSWGPYDAARPSVSYPFAWLAAIVPGLRGVRSPGRFGAMLGLPMAVFLVFVIHVFSRGRARGPAGRLSVAALGVLLLAESLPIYAIHSYALPHRAVYEDVRTAIAPGTPLLELPIADRDHFATIHRAMDQLMGSTIHWGRLVSGYGARSTPDYQSALDIDRRYKDGAASIDEFVAFCRQRGIGLLLVHVDDYPEPAATAWRTFIGGLSVPVQLRNGQSFLLRLPPADDFAVPQP